ncbi:sensor histidine kinase, partial [Clostridium botulinum]|nr:sensor histidine kinase [Clostridium botulinum]
MKQSLLKRLILIISLILFISFVIGQIFGFFIIKEWFLKEQLKQLVPVMENISHETRINNGTIIIKNEGKLIIKAYNLNNDEIPINDNNIKKYIYFSDEEIKEDLLPYINIVLKGEKVATIESLNHIKGRSII